MTSIDRRVEQISKFLALLAAACAGLIMLTMAADVAHRLYTGGSIRGAFELVETLVILIVFLGLGYAERSDAHVRVQLVTSRLPPLVADWVRAFGLLVAAGVVAWLTYATAQQAWTSWTFGEYRHGAVVAFPTWPARIVVAVGFFLLTAELLLKTFSILRHRGEPATHAGQAHPRGS